MRIAFLSSKPLAVRSNFTSTWGVGFVVVPAIFFKIFNLIGEVLCVEHGGWNSGL